MQLLSTIFLLCTRYIFNKVTLVEHIPNVNCTLTYHFIAFRKLGEGHKNDQNHEKCRTFKIPFLTSPAAQGARGGDPLV